MAQNPDDFRFTSRLAILSRDYGGVACRSGASRALRIFDEALSHIRATPNARARREVAALLATSSYALRALGREDEALARIDEALDLLRQTGQLASQHIEPLGEVEHAVRALGEHYLATGFATGAVALFEQLLAGLERSPLNLSGDLRDAASLSRTWAALERACEADGQSARARSCRAQRRALWKEWVRRQPRNPFARRQFDATG
jgi:tetratricopeptide (TPR) repeat protein